MLRSGIRIVAVEICVSANINSFSAVDDLPEFRTELRVRSVSAGPQRVAT